MTATKSLQDVPLADPVTATANVMAVLATLLTKTLMIADVRFSPMIKLVTFVPRTEPDVEVELVLRESDRPLMAVSPAFFPNDNFHRLYFFVIEDDTCAGVGGEQGVRHGRMVWWPWSIASSG